MLRRCFREEKLLAHCPATLIILQNSYKPSEITLQIGNIRLDEKLLALCGTNCGLCSYYTKERTPHCPGCNTQKGQPFWGSCKLYACAREHEVEHCGLCSEFPCDLFIDQYDPEHGQRSAFTRAGLLAYRRKAGTEKYIEITKKLRDEEAET